MLGFQTGVNFHYEVAKPCFDMILNNKGDPLEQSQFALNTKTLESAVVDYFAGLWRIHQLCPSNEKEREYWGYITSMGTTEGNLLALYNAREYLSGMPLANPNLQDKQCSQSYAVDVSKSSDERTCKEERPQASSNNENNAYTPVVFFSEESYHGNAKCFHMVFLHLISVSQK